MNSTKTICKTIFQYCSTRTHVFYGLSVGTTKLTERSCNGYIHQTVFNRKFASNDSKPIKFAQAFEEQENIKDELSLISYYKTTDKINTKNASFATLLRNSAFVGLGSFHGKLVTGKVVEVCDGNLFIDYGGKFLCVCKKPRNSPSDIGPGSTVNIKLLDWELSARFLGATKDITLLESEATIYKVEPKSSKKVRTKFEEGDVAFRLIKQ